VTQWVENPEGGRARGPAGLLRAWVEVLVRPRRFFRNGVAPGDQAPGLVFAVCVAVAYLGARYLLEPTAAPRIGDSGSTVSAALALLLAGLLVAPLTLHLVATMETLLLMALAPDRGGVSETVQVLAYAAAPGVFAAAPFPEVRLLAALWGAALLTVGTATVHRLSPARAVVVTALPAAVVFGYAFGGFAAFEALTGVTVVPDPAASGTAPATPTPAGG